MSSSVENSVIYMKVTEALRAPGPERLAELAKTYNIADFPNLLLQAVELSTFETIQWVVDLYQAKGRNVNEVDPKTGNTALHEAVISGRVRPAMLLMSIPSLDNTIQNKNGVTPVELASTPEMEQALASAENKFAQATAMRLKVAFKNHDLNELVRIYSNPRVSVLLDINGIDPDTGRTTLHDMAQAGDVKIVQFILAHGGDPMVRDRKFNKLPQDFTDSEDIKRVLNNSAKSKAILDQTHGVGGNTNAAAGAKGGPTGQASAPSMSGYLKKWTNITSGYKLRWFVLQNGTLSYYKKPEEAKRGDKMIKGSMGLRYAKVRLYSGEKNTFEVRTPSTKFHLKATHPAEANKWVWALQSAITFVRDEEKRASKSTSSQSTPDAENGAPAAATGTAAGAAVGATGGTVAGPTGGAGNAKAPSNNGSRNAAPNASATGVNRPRSVSNNSVSNNSLARTASNTSMSGRHVRKTSVAGSVAGSVEEHDDSMFVNDLGQKDDEDDSDNEDEELTDELVLRGPHITGESLIARLSAVKDLLTILVFQVNDETMRDAITTAQGSIDVVSSDIVMIQKQFRAEKRQAKAKLDQSDKGQRMWASNYRDLELQCEKLEGQVISLKKQLGKADEDSDDEFFDTVDSADREKSRPEPAAPPAGIPETVQESPDERETGVPRGFSNAPPAHSAAHQEGVAGSHGPADGAGAVGAAGAAGAAGVAGAAGASAASESTGTGADHAPQDQQREVDGATDPGSGDGQPQPAQPSAGGADKDQGNSGLGAANADEMTPQQREVYEKIQAQKSFAGYEDPPRERLKIDADNRPKLSLWGILKNLIGKDMTKMTLPVTFNECTSLLQRSAEDMEYVELLDKAAASVDDAGLRMAYVAAFAGSSYSSTIDRVAKPFNPLLGETYEYARPDQGYRLFAEQVSHHPPIGALMAESRNWDFYGESNVESKFYGRSFDINPLGVWYLNLRPNKGSETETELYSFRKLTSSVVGIMMGSPVVDNYGDMVITNHTLGVKAVVSYKPRGWRGSSAYKLHGKITAKDGTELWTIAGQWNDKMWAKKSEGDEKILLWQVHPRHRTPFNLTDFAITLNALPDRLKPWLAPTDTRLRPDQRAMEEGRYDDASVEKGRVEDKQRQVRREREMSGQEYKPQWFEAAQHPVTGDRYYKPINNYWQQRAEHHLADKGDIF